VLELVGCLQLLLSAWLVGYGLIGPNLAMWMGVATTHHLPTVFEDLDVINVGVFAQLTVLLNPQIYDRRDIFEIHPRQACVVSWRKTQNAASS
jgi:hypothetical protein